MDRQAVIDRIKEVAAQTLPPGSVVYLYGSQACGDSGPDSDWDLLVLLDKPERSSKDWELYGWPFTEMGWDIGEDISARTYTKEQWRNGPHSMFYFNVEEDKQLLYESERNRPAGDGYIDIDQQDVESFIEPARQMIDKIKQYIESHG